MSWHEEKGAWSTKQCDYGGYIQISHKIEFVEQGQGSYENGGQLVANSYYILGFRFEAETQRCKHTQYQEMGSRVTADVPSLNHASLLRVSYCCCAVPYNYCGPPLLNVYSPPHVSRALWRSSSGGRRILTSHTHYEIVNYVSSCPLRVSSSNNMDWTIVKELKGTG
jgi:hypothetical protein